MPRLNKDGNRPPTAGEEKATKDFASKSAKDQLGGNYDPKTYGAYAAKRDKGGMYGTKPSKNFPTKLPGKK